MQIVSNQGAGRASRMLVVVAAMLMARAPSQAQYTRAPMRTISGTVQDGGHEPLRGAVVQIEAVGTLVIQSYVTDEKGEYHFRNMSSDTDYTLWATFRGNKSKTHPVGKFDHTPDRVIPLEIELAK
jgi:hypothetical protein